MPDKTKPKKDSGDIRVRMNSQEKELWIEFIKEKPQFKNLSQLVRFCVNEYIEKGEFKVPSEDFAPIIKELLEEKRLERIAHKQELDALLKKVREEQQNRKDSEITMKIKSSLFNLLKTPKTSEEVYDIYKDIFPITENEITDILNDMHGHNFIRMNNKLQYEVVKQNGN